MLPMNLIVCKISPHKVGAIFDACVLTFITRSGSVPAHDRCLEYLLQKSNYVNKTMHARIDFYA